MGIQTKAVETPYGVGFICVDAANIKRFVEAPMPAFELFREDIEYDYHRIWIKEIGDGQRLIWATYWCSDGGAGCCEETGLDSNSLPEYVGWTVAELIFEDDKWPWGSRERLVEAFIPAYISADDEELERIAADCADSAYREVLGM